MSRDVTSGVKYAFVPKRVGGRPYRSISELQRKRLKKMGDYTKSKVVAGVVATIIVLILVFIGVMIGVSAERLATTESKLPSSTRLRYQEACLHNQAQDLPRFTIFKFFLFYSWVAV